MPFYCQMNRAGLKQQQQVHHYEKVCFKFLKFYISPADTEEGHPHVTHIQNCE